MKRSVLQTLALIVAMSQAAPSMADPAEFSFAVIAPPRTSVQDDSAFQTAIEETDAENLAFVAVQGIKASNAPCTDKVYLRQKSLLEKARNGIVVSIAASDWAKCPPDSGKSSAIARLGRLRDLFFFDDFSLGESRIPVVRQSTIAKFRSFPENARWQIGNVMFATINLPSNNNNYVVDAGRNSEFEDRLVANRDWLNRVFTYAQREKAAGLVLFGDSSPFSAANPSTSQRDGYAETRKLIASLSAKFPGKILVVHGQAPADPKPGVINWRGNVGELVVSPGWTKVNVDAAQNRLFSLDAQTVQATEGSR
jgi:hypothetical protein